MSQEPTVVRTERYVTVDNGHIELKIDQKNGIYDLLFKNGVAVRSAFGEAKVEGRVRKTSDYASHNVTSVSSRDALGSGVQVTVRHRSPGEPELRQEFWIYRDKPEAVIRLAIVDPQGVSSNYLAPIKTETALKLPREGPLQSLFVPWDNDFYFRYRSDGWGEGEGDGDGSYEVGAVYDNVSRLGLVVGSLEHDVWKSAVRFVRNAKGEVASFRGYAGVTSKYTHDKEPHGAVSGKEVQSPRMVVGVYSDWRDGMERFGDLNALVKPPLKWDGGVPFGWNSWSGHKTKLQAEHADAAADFLQHEMPWLRNDGIAYVNLDSFWDNMTREQRAAFVKKAHAAGLKAGIYYTPFVSWGELHTKVVNSSYIYRDLALKDSKGEPLPKLSGGYPIDPTHPGTIARMDRQLDEFIEMGFDFVKFDFMSHGALEGRHYDPTVTTGAAAYAKAMRHIVDKLSKEKIFISLSIAPMFPQGYAHSRRISCDAFANIGATEYLMNSSSYGWWTNGRIYQFNDADSSCVYQPLGEPPVSLAEARSRYTASVISGGMMIEGDDLTNPEARKRVLEIFSNREILNLAKQNPSFRPVEADSATKATNLLYWKGDDAVYLAAFNYDGKASSALHVDLKRIGLPEDKYRVLDLWTGKSWESGDRIRLDLGPAECAFLKIR